MFCLHMPYFANPERLNVLAFFLTRTLFERLRASRCDIAALNFGKGSLNDVSLNYKNGTLSSETSKHYMIIITLSDIRHRTHLEGK